MLLQKWLSSYFVDPKFQQVTTIFAFHGEWFAVSNNRECSHGIKSKD
jgi:hypothetical protein